MRGERRGAAILAVLLGVLVWFGAPALVMGQDDAAEPVTTVEAVVVVDNADTLLPETPSGDTLSLPTPLLIAMTVGFLLPPLQAFVQKPGTDPLIKSALMVTISVVASFVQLWSQGHLDGALASGDFLRILLVTGITAQGSYLAFWKRSTATTRIEAHTPGLV